MSVLQWWERARAPAALSTGGQKQLQDIVKHFAFNAAVTDISRPRAAKLACNFFLATLKIKTEKFFFSPPPDRFATHGTEKAQMVSSRIYS